VIGSEFFGYMLAVAVALSGAAGARLKNSGELAKVSKEKPLYTLLATLLYGISGLAAVFYFSWAYLDWKQIVVFLVVAVFLTSWLAKTGSRVVVWTVFNLSVATSMASEFFLLVSPNTL